MNPFQALKLFGIWKKFRAVEKEKVTMNLKITHYITLLASLSATIGLPALATEWLKSHLPFYVGFVLAAIVLHAVLPSIFSAPSDEAKKAAGLDKVGILLLLLFVPGLLHAQPKAPAPTEANLQNVYAAGVSWNNAGVPSVAGTGLYAHLLADTGTYAFTAVDALPNTLKPFTVTTNIGLGVAQKVVTIGTVPIYIPSSAGISFTGSNTGWQWNAGALGSIHLSGQYYLMPTVRIVKSSVSNGSGYQPIVGLLFAWGR